MATRTSGKSIQELSAFTHSIRLTSSDFTTAGSAQAHNVSVGIGAKVRDVAFKLHTAFDGGSTSGLVMDIGDGSDVDAFINNVELHADATEVFYGPTAAADFGALFPGYVYRAAGNIVLTFTASGANIDTLDAGDIEVFFNIIDIDDVSDEITK
tara:strand:- start:508 stop:969 length:462 start_codon:yes stop_codon:yes gene_type:complete